MVSNVNIVWIATSCLFLVPCLIVGRPSLIPSLNSRIFLPLNNVDYSRFQIPQSSKSVEELPSEKPPTKECSCKCEKPTDDIQNEVELFLPSSTSAPQTAKVRQPSPIQYIPAYRLTPTSCLPQSRKRRTRLSVDTYPIGDIKFDIDTRRTHGNMNTTVIAECNFLVGLDDFQKHNPPQILTWKKLKTRCPVSIVTGGIREGRGEAAIQVEPLYAQLKMSPVDLRKKELAPIPLELQMTEVKKASVSIQNLEGFPADYSRVISAEIEKTMVCIVNLDVRNVLKDSLKCFQDGSSTSCTLASGYPMKS